MVDYIRELGYTQIGYLIGTHPHEDHIGGLPAVLQAFDVVNFYMPKVVHTTKTFENVLDAAEQNGLKIQTAKGRGRAPGGGAAQGGAARARTG